MYHFVQESLPLGLSLSSPIFGHDGGLKGIVASDYLLSGLSEKLKIMFRGQEKKVQAYIFEKDTHYNIATSMDINAGKNSFLDMTSMTDGKNKNRTKIDDEWFWVDEGDESWDAKEKKMLKDQQMKIKKIVKHFSKQDKWSIVSSDEAFDWNDNSNKVNFVSCAEGGGCLDGQVRMCESRSDYELRLTSQHLPFRSSQYSDRTILNHFTNEGGDYFVGGDGTFNDVTILYFTPGRNQADSKASPKVRVCEEQSDIRAGEERSDDAADIAAFSYCSLRSSLSLSRDRPKRSTVPNGSWSSCQRRPFRRSTSRRAPTTTRSS